MSLPLCQERKIVSPPWQDLHERARHLVVATLCAWGVVILSSPAVHAQAGSASCPSEPISNESRRDSLTMTMLGVACFERGEFGKALTYYRAAYAKSQDPLLEATIGRSLHELGLLDRAKIYYELYLDHERRDVDGRRRVEERLSRLEEQLEDDSATVTIEAFPGMANVYVRTYEGHRELLGVTPLTVRLEPRAYAFTLEQMQFHPDTFEVSLSPGEEERVTRELVPQRSTFNLTTRGTRRAGAVTMAVGLPIALAGGISRLAGWPLSFRESHAVALVGTSTILAGALLTIFAYRRERKLEMNHTELTLSTTLSSGGLSFGLTW